MPKIDRILIYPIKSLDSLERTEVRVMPHGGLEGDRAYFIRDADRNLINGKREPALHRIRACYEWPERFVRFSLEDSDAVSRFNLDRERDGASAWLSTVLGRTVQLFPSEGGYFPDDLHSPGPTVVAAATVAAMAGWFSDLAVDEMVRRLRPNVVIGGTEPFWDDRLFDETDAGSVRFRMGDAHFLGRNPCQRCAVPSRDSRTGQADPTFVRRFRERRKEQLASWAPANRFDHFYRAAVNTARADTPDDRRRIRVGDPVTIER